MNQAKLPCIFLSPPHMGGQEETFIQEVLQTNWVTTGGPMVSDFEEDLQSYVEKGQVVALNSGTAAIHLGLLILGVQAGDEVLCQSLTFVASANPILYIGATPIFIDSEPTTWNICPIALEEAITDRIAKGKKPKGIITVSLYGMPYQVEAIRGIADQYGIPILEDSAQAFGSSYKGQKCGSFGNVGVFSFNGSKVITTSGGGALIVQNEELKEQAIFLSTQAKDPAPYYQHSQLGYNYRMTTIAAAIGRGQLKSFDAHLVRRKEIHQFYATIFSEVEWIVLQESPNTSFVSNYWLNVITVLPNQQGITVAQIQQLAEQENIETRRVMKPLHQQPLFEHYPYYGQNVAEGLFLSSLCLPSSSNLTNEDLQRIKKCFLTLLKN